MTTIFTKIINGEIPADKVFENDRILAFKDINPVAPVHLLNIPKKEITELQSVAKEDLGLVAEMIEVAQNLAKEFDVENGYRLIANNGPLSGQEVLHLHFHLIGGKQLGSLG